MEQCANCTNPVSEKAVQLNHDLYEQLNIHNSMEKDYIAEKLMEAIGEYDIFNEDTETETILNSLCGACFISALVQGLMWLNEGIAEALGVKD